MSSNMCSDTVCFSFPSWRSCVEMNIAHPTSRWCVRHCESQTDKRRQTQTHTHARTLTLTLTLTDRERESVVFPSLPARLACYATLLSSHVVVPVCWRLLATLRPDARACDGKRARELAKDCNLLAEQAVVDTATDTTEGQSSSEPKVAPERKSSFLFLDERQFFHFFR